MTRVVDIFNKLRRRFYLGQAGCTLLAAALLVLLYGCQRAGDSVRLLENNAFSDETPQIKDPPASEMAVTGENSDMSSPSPPSVPVVTTLIDARPAAIINSHTIFWSQLKPILSEAAGAAALQEAILNHLIDKALDERGLKITADDLAGERRLLIQSLDDDPNTAIRLLRELRNRQGLGMLRFNQLLRRNAALRAMVRDQVQVTDESVSRVYEIVHGEKRQARIMIIPTLADAQSAVGRIRSGEPFADVAVALSTDTSASRGGLLEPISRLDPTYPDVLRRILFQLQEAEVSTPVLLNEQYALILLVKINSPDQLSMKDTRKEIEWLVRIGQERLLMDQLARTMIASVNVTIFDKYLRESWKHREMLNQ